MKYVRGVEIKKKIFIITFRHELPIFSLAGPEGGGVHEDHRGEFIN